MNLKAWLVRRGFAKSDAKRDAGLTIPEDVELSEALSYGGHKMNTLDVSRPKGAGALPLIINVHGGGYVYGSTLPYRYYCASLAQRGFAVVSFNYRLAPEFCFPTPLYDLNAVMQWCFDNAEKYGLDMENVFMVGDSAGAQLASQYAAICSNPEYAGIMEIYPPEALRFAAVGLNCGMYELSSHAKKRSGINSVMSSYFTKDPSVFGEKLNVLDYINADYPPCHLISAPGDFLLGCCEPMWRLLRRRGVEAEYKIYGDKSTGHVFHVNVRLPVGQQANDDQTAFFRRYIR